MRYVTPLPYRPLIALDKMEIVALGLYNPLSGSGGPFGAVGDAAVELFNSTAAAAAADPNIQARMADVFTFFDGRGPELSHIAELPPDVHPNDSGHYLMAQAVVMALGLPTDAVAAPPGATVRAPGASGDGDDDTPWVLYIGLVVGGVAVVAMGLVVLARRRATRAPNLEM